MATSARDRTSARMLTGHALVLGVGWMPVIFPLYGSSRLRESLSALPDVLQGGVTVLLVVAAIPVLWPGLIAAGLHEGALAERIAAGDRASAVRAARFLSLQALAFAALAVAVGGLALSMRDGWWAHTHVQLAWIAPAVVGIAHWLLSRHVQPRAAVSVGG